MLSPTIVTLDPETVMYEIEQVLTHLGEGRIDSVPYDTAWMARLAQMLPNEGFDGALDWLRDSQFDDGSWGGNVMHYHDRFISTLSAIVALRVTGNSSDERRVQQGEDFLWRIFSRLYHDSDDTIGFPVLAVSLLNEARSLGLDVPRELYCDVATIEKKLNMIGRDSKGWRYTSMSFSLEAVRPDFPAEFDFLEDNGSVGTSPAATAAVLLQTGDMSRQALDYLKRTVGRQPDGGAPNVSPIDTFETAWSLNYLRQAGAVMPDHPQVQRLLAKLWQAWSPTNGIGFSSFYSVPNLDDTASSFAALQWGGYPVHPNVFAHYEQERHFRCFPQEANPSVSANVRTYGALESFAHETQYHNWQEKIAGMLRRLDIDGALWFDKWHVSPYYLRSTAVHLLHKNLPELVRPFVKWMLRTQLPDGGWGFLGESTAEETAYALQTLLHWNRTVERLDPAPIDAAAAFLGQYVHGNGLATLWIGKCLYKPSLVVRSAILAALYAYVAQ